MFLDKEVKLKRKNLVEKKPENWEDLGNMILKAKEIVDDSNLINQMQLEITQQQSKLNDKISRRRKKEKKHEE